LTTRTDFEITREAPILSRFIQYRSFLPHRSIIITFNTTFYIQYRHTLYSYQYLLLSNDDIYSADPSDVDGQRRVKTLPLGALDELLLVDEEVLRGTISTPPTSRKTGTPTKGHSTSAPLTSDSCFLTRSRGIPGTTCPALIFGT
jgi:hypothetical protein